jgi:hypothetical protein
MTSAPLFVHCRHCLNRQRQTGDAFVLNALIETERLAFASASPAAVCVPAGSGRPHRIFRCEGCRTALASEYGGVAKLRFLRVGTLDAPHALTPDAHIYARSRVAWVALSPGVPAFAAHYDSATLWPAESLARRAAIFV